MKLGPGNKFSNAEECQEACVVESPATTTTTTVATTTVATTTAVAERKGKNARCLRPIHYCKFRIHTPGWNYIMENNTCVFTYYSGCPDKVR